MSEELAKQTKILKHKIQERSSDLTLQDDSNYICSLIDEFKGFDAKGFFTLNHSLLTGFIANFFTFIVILMGLNGDHFSWIQNLWNEREILIIIIVIFI